MQQGAIILCGGESIRMGDDKGLLPFGADEVLLQRVVRLLSDVVPMENMVVVAARRQQLPSLPSDVRVVCDQHEDRGPLEGLATGMAALGDHAEVAYATGCDVPLLESAFVERMFFLLGQSQAAIPVNAARCYPLAAVYRTSLLPQLREMLGQGIRALQALSDTSGVKLIPTEQLREADPQLATLEKCNTPADYQAALVRCGLLI